MHGTEYGHHTSTRRRECLGARARYTVPFVGYREAEAAVPGQRLHLALQVLGVHALVQLKKDNMPAPRALETRRVTPSDAEGKPTEPHTALVQVRRWRGA
jgi:hypothetical protein